MATRRRETWIGLIGWCIAFAVVIVQDDQIARLENRARDHDASRVEIASIKARVSDLRSECSAVNRASGAAIMALSDRLSPDTATLSNTLLAPAVQLNGADRVGSGTLVCSRVDATTGETLNYVLTAWHVVRDIIKGDADAEIDVRLYQAPEAPLDLSATLVAKNARIDAALLRISSCQVFAHVAEVLPSSDDRSVSVWSAVYCIGCPLGNDPIPTGGFVSSLHNEVAGSNYWMINAPAYYGNSGGAVFLAGSRKLIGVFSKVYTNAGNVVTHMGLMTPVSSIHAWLEDLGLDHLLAGSSHGAEACGTKPSVSPECPQLLATNGTLVDHRAVGRDRDF